MDSRQVELPPGHGPEFAWGPTGWFQLGPLARRQARGRLAMVAAQRALQEPLGFAHIARPKLPAIAHKLKDQRAGAVRVGHRDAPGSQRAEDGDTLATSSAVCWVRRYAVWHSTSGAIPC